MLPVDGTVRLLTEELDTEDTGVIIMQDTDTSSEELLEYAAVPSQTLWLRRVNFMQYMIKYSAKTPYWPSNRYQYWNGEFPVSFSRWKRRLQLANLHNVYKLRKQFAGEESGCSL